MAGLLRPAMGSSVRKITDVEVADGAVYDLFAVRRNRGPAQYLDRIHRAGNVNRKAKCFLNAAAPVDVKRDVRHLLRSDVDAVDVACRPEDDRFVVGRPRHRRIESVNRPRLLHIAIEAVIQRCLFARFEIEDEDRRLVANAPNEREDLPSGDGVGRTEPPGPVTYGSISPVCRSRRWMM